MKRKGLFVAALIMLLAQAARAQFNIPRRQGLVNDFAAKLSSEAKKSIESRLRDFTSRNQIELDVVTIPLDHLKGRPIEQYSIQMANKWEIGSGLGKVGLLLLVAIGQADGQGVYRGSTRLEVSRRLEADIPNDVAAEIIRSMRDDLKAGRFSEAIQRGIDGTDRALAKKLDSSSQPLSKSNTPLSQESSQGSGATIILFVIFAIIAGPILILIFVVAKLSRLGQQGGYGGSRFGGANRLGTFGRSYHDTSSSFASHNADSHSTSNDWSSSSSSDSSPSSSDWSSSSSDSSSSSGDSGSSGGGDFSGGGASDSW